MDLKDLIGQMVWMGFHGTEPSEEVERLICDHRVGGVVLFSRNVRTPKQVRELTDSLRELAERSGHELPLVVAVDQEGGGVSCLKDGFTQFPPPMAMGATRSPGVVRRAFEVIGRELRTVGVGVDFAPVLDVNTNPENPIIGTRSFGDDPELVAKLGEEAVRGLQDEGVAATAKHFPGHGDTSLDTHLVLPRVGHPTERLRKVELLPFSKAVDAGVRAVMTTHIVFEALDPELPATVSPKVLTDLLRGEMGFDGMVVTDCLEMKAMERFWPEAPFMALRAGADVALISHTYELQVEALKLLRRAVEEGRLRMDTVSASVGRISALKRRVRIPSIPADEVPDLVGRPEDEAFCRRLSRSAFTLVRGMDLLPLRPSPGDRLLLVLPEGERSSWDILVEGLTGRYPKAEVLRVGTEPSEEDVRGAVELASGAVAIVVSKNSHLNPAYAGLLRALGDTSKSLIVLGVGTPYELGVLPERAAYLAVYGSQPQLLESAVEVLSGKIRPCGKLPVSLGR